MSSPMKPQQTAGHTQLQQRSCGGRSPVTRPAAGTQNAKARTKPFETQISKVPAELLKPARGGRSPVNIAHSALDSVTASTTSSPAPGSRTSSIKLSRASSASHSSSQSLLKSGRASARMTVKGIAVKETEAESSTLVGKSTENFGRVKVAPKLVACTTRPGKLNPPAALTLAPAPARTATQHLGQTSPSMKALLKADPDSEIIAEVAPELPKRTPAWSKRKLDHEPKKKLSRFEVQLGHVLATLNSANSLSAEGLHRKPGDEKVLKSLKAKVKQKKTVTFKPGQGSVHDATGLLKHMFTVPFSKDGETLLPADLREKLYLSLDEDPEALAAWLMNELPEANKTAFISILDHFVYVARNAKLNKMDENNLATIYGTKLAWDDIHPLVLLSKSSNFTAVMKVLIEGQKSNRWQAA